MCLSQEFLNPVDKERRDVFMAGLTSGNPATVAATIAGAAAQGFGWVMNPTQFASEVLGFKPQNPTEAFISGIPGVNIIAGVGRSWGLW